MGTDVLVDYESVGGPRVQPGSIHASAISSRLPSSRLPSYHTLAYLEKVGTVSLLALAFIYLVTRTFRAGPMAAIAEVGGKRI